MKVKRYTVLALLFVCAKSFAGITTTIVAPAANSTNPGHMLVTLKVVSSYDVTVKVNISGTDFTLQYNATKQVFEGSVDLTSFSEGPLTLKTTVTDVFNTVDTASVNIIYSKSSPFSNKFTSPSVGEISPNHMFVSTSTSSKYPLASVTANIAGVSFSLTAFTSTVFIGTLDLSTLPNANFTMKLVTTDIAGNIDSATTLVINHNAAYKPVSTQITAPIANYVELTNKLIINAKITNLSSYKATRCIAYAGRYGPGTALFYVNSTVGHAGSIDITSVPAGYTTLYVYTYDNRGNIDTATITFLRHKSPKINVIKNWPNSWPVVTQPFLHIKAESVSYSKNCAIRVYNAKDNKLLITGGNVLDTVIDVTGIAYNGVGSIDYNVYNQLKIVVTDSLGYQDAVDYFYIYEPSPYVKAIDSMPKPRVSLTENITNVKDSCWYYDDGAGDPPQEACIQVPTSYSFTITTPTISVTRAAYYNTNRLGEVFKEVLAYNDNYIVWQDDAFIHRLNLNTLEENSVAGTFATKASEIALDSNGNFATSHDGTVYRFYNNTMQVVATGAQPQLAIYGNNVAYFKGTTLYLNNSVTDVVVDMDVVTTSTYNVEYIKMNSGLIAYYKNGNLGQRAIWLADASLNKKRITFSFADAYLQELNKDGSIIYGQRAYSDGLATFYVDRFGNTKQLASCGTYHNQDSARYVFMSQGGSFIINLNPGTDSLAPINREVKKDSAVAFAKTDFDNAYTGPGHVFKVKITGLPKFGTLFINKIPITLDSVVAHASLGGLSYKPNPGYSGKDTIRFTVWNGAEFVANDTIIELSVVATLPVNLLSFTGKALGKANQLRWQTAQEVNSSYFGLEKSTDGVHFNSIGNVIAKGSSSITESYEYLDAAPQAGLNYYRLKIVDKDASYGYSQTISIRNTGSYITLAYPNPAKNFVNLSFTAARAGRYSFTLYSASGKAVSTNRYTVATGSQNITLPLSGMASGTYIIKVVDAEGNTVTEQKVVKQ